MVLSPCQLTRIHSPAPFYAPPPFTLFEFYDLSRNRVPCSNPCIGKITGMTFPMQNCTRFFCQQILHFFLVLTNSFFHEKSLLSNFDPPLLHSYRQTLTSNPELLNFTPAMPTIFANTANPVFIPVFYFSTNNGEGLEGGGGSSVKGYDSKFSQNSHRYSPAQTLYFLTHYTATKIHSRCWRSPLAKKKYTAIRTLRLWPMLISTA